MSDLEDDYSSDGDDDYVPEGELSEGDSDDAGVAESGDEEVTGEIKADTKTKKKQPKKKTNNVTRKRKGGIQLEGDNKEEDKDANEEEEQLVDVLSKEEKEKKKEEAEKKRADDLWSSFMKDVGPPKKAKTSASESTTNKDVNSVSSSNKVSDTKPQSTAAKTSAPQESKKKEMVTVTKVFDFAGEKVKVEEKVSADSKEAKTLMNKEDMPSTSVIKKTPAGLSIGGVKRPGGLSSVLGQIGKKSKISTLEKSKLDWNRFKAKEGIEEEVSAFVKGKSGYVEKQNFLARADHRQYEKERELRMSQQKILR